MGTRGAGGRGGGAHRLSVLDHGCGIAGAGGEPQRGSCQAGACPAVQHRVDEVQPLRPPPGLPLQPCLRVPADPCHFLSDKEPEFPRAPRGASLRRLRSTRLIARDAPHTSKQTYVTTDFTKPIYPAAEGLIFKKAQSRCVKVGFLVKSAAYLRSSGGAAMPPMYADTVTASIAIIRQTRPTTGATSTLLAAVAATAAAAARYPAPRSRPAVVTGAYGSHTADRPAQVSRMPRRLCWCRCITRVEQGREAASAFVIATANMRTCRHIFRVHLLHLVA